MAQQASRRAEISPSEPGLSRALAGRLAELDWPDLPTGLVEKIKLFTLDNLGVLGGAAGAPGIPELNAALRAWEPSGGAASALVGGFHASPPTAALANGSAAHALDFDDQHDPARIHTFCTVLPAALAAAEAEGSVSGKRFIAALAVGAELSCRLGLACYNSLGKGWHPTTALGALAAAAAAGKIFRLDPDQMLNALGIAFVQMGGTTQSNADGVLTKRMGAGLAARTGVLSAHLARNGLTGPHRFLEGAAGLFALHERGEVTPALLVEGLGREWRLAEVSLKPFPCCRASHTVIQIALDLHGEGLRADDIGSGEIMLGRVNWQMVGAPFDPPKDNPVVHAQFNASYAFTRALVDGRIDLASFQRAQILASDMAPARRLRCVDAPDIAADAVAPARVRLRLRNGQEIERFRGVMKGSPDDPMSAEEIVRKFRSCLAFGLDAGTKEADCLIGVTLALDTMGDVADLVRAFPARRESQTGTDRAAAE